MTTQFGVPDTHHSSFREKLLEHVFISELLQEAWLKHHKEEGHDKGE